MPFSIESWMVDYCQAVNKTFGTRVRFIGLQAASPGAKRPPRSDIDAVLILDRADAADLTAYSALLDRLPERERSCGFISGWEELTHWEPSELLQFYYDTIPYEGSLDPLLRQITPETARQAVHAGACGIYHGCAHNLVHDHSPDILRGLFKSAPLCPPGGGVPADRPVYPGSRTPSPKRCRKPTGHCSRPPAG